MTVKMCRLVALCMMCVATVCVTTSGQEKEGLVDYRVTVPVIAVVRDSHGKIVSDLKHDDFVLEEDGRPQSLRMFGAQTKIPLTLGLLVDTNPGQRKALEQERSATGKFVHAALRENKDSGFLIHFDRDAELLQDVTKSNQKLNDAVLGLQAMTLEQPGQRGGDSKSSGGRRDDDDTRGQGGRGERGFRGPKKLLYDSLFLSNDELLKNQQGRKVVVLMSDGVDRGSKSTIEDAIESAQRADTVVYAVYFASERVNESGERGRWGQGRVSGPWPGGGGGGYPSGGGRYPGGGGGYPGGQGGGRPTEPEEPKVDGKKVLERIARETGGRMFEVSKKQTLEQVYQQIQEELGNQYFLSYQPSRSEDEIRDYHKITLTTKNKDFVVQARDGYYAPVHLDEGKESK